MKIDTGDTAWVLISTALVMLMTPGLALFYAGMVRKKNVLGTMIQSFAMIALIGVQWILWGYSLAFGPDKGGFIGSLSWIGLKHVGLEPSSYAPTIPHQLFMMYQGMFAIITPALITGAFAERVRFKPFIIFMLLWATLVYDPVCHWVWGDGGWLRNMGVLDFAGGTVVHICSGVAALACVFVIGPRRNFGREDVIPHSVMLTLVGTGLLWFGWFGFNAGSALTAGPVAVSAFVATNTAAAAAAMVWIFVEWWHRGKPTALGAASGAVAGLAGITQASGYVTPMVAIIIGSAVSLLCYGAIFMKSKLRYDDSLDVFGVHGVAGICGAIAVGLFASKVINPAGANGLFNGNAKLLGIQALMVLIVGSYSFIMTMILVKLTGAFSPIRVSKEDEELGLDLSQHGELAYHTEDL